LNQTALERDEASLHHGVFDAHPDRFERVVATRRCHRQYFPHYIGNVPAIVAWL